MKDIQNVQNVWTKVKRVSSTGQSFLKKGLNGVLSGEIGLTDATREGLRKGRQAIARSRERQMLNKSVNQTARLRREFGGLTADALLRHFRERTKPHFFPGFEDVHSTVKLQQQLFSKETTELLELAQQIIKAHRWPLLGFGEMSFGQDVSWRCDPLSGRFWPLEFHAKLKLWHEDGSDIRVLWELNRLGHLLTVARAYVITNDEQLAEEFFAQIESWSEQNPVGYGPNWACAMEVALRAINILSALLLFRHSIGLTEARLLSLLTLLEQHGAHIERNLEFSYITTSNHYLSDLTGLLWLGLLLPEFEAAPRWRKLALSELHREMEKQILPDGVDYEASTSYHRFVLELFLYSFVLCRANGIDLPNQFSLKLSKMLEYLGAYIRPDGMAPLIGDSDSGQVLPIKRRTADDHSYLLAVGAAVLKDSKFKLAGLEVPEELLWLLGRDEVESYQHLSTRDRTLSSRAFRNGGVYILRDEDLYLLFNAGNSEGTGRRSHGHNDALSIEISACGRSFLADPGTYVYTANLQQRHLFRSTRYHSTVEVDDVEQKSIEACEPFQIGVEAKSQVISWQTDTDVDRVSAEHIGYRRLGRPVTHRRTIVFLKKHRCWLVEDEIIGQGEHKITARFHFDTGLEVELYHGNSVKASDKATGARLFISADGIDATPNLEEQCTSKDYGSKSPSMSACWTLKKETPLSFRWTIIPICMGEDEAERIRLCSTANKT